MGWESETLRFPTTLDQEGIVRRLVRIRAMAQDERSMAELATMLEGVEHLPASKLGIAIIGATGFVAGKPDYAAVARKLEILAVNLKNLK